MKRLGPGKAGEEREVRHHDHHDKSGQPSRSLGALGLVFILGLAMGAVARGGGPSTGESAVPAATEPWTVSVEPPTASTGSSKASTPAAAQEAAASDRPCNVDGSGDCGAHGRCYLGWCVCARGWQGRRCDVSDGSPCTMNTAESAAHLDACEATIRRVDEQYKKRSRSRGGATIGRETRGGACGSVLESTDKCAASPTAGAVVVEERRWRLAQAFEAATWRQLGSRGEDRDETHLRQYDAYSMIFPRHFERALEIGCGPWTQTRTLLAATGATVGTLTLSDPLLETYIQDVSTCSYKNADTYRRTLAGKRRPAGQAGPAGRPPSYKPEFVIRKLEFAPAGGEDLRPGGGVVVRDAPHRKVVALLRQRRDGDREGRPLRRVRAQEVAGAERLAEDARGERVDAVAAELPPHPQRAARGDGDGVRATRAHHQRVLAGFGQRHRRRPRVRRLAHALLALAAEAAGASVGRSLDGVLMGGVMIRAVNVCTC